MAKATGKKPSSVESREHLVSQLAKLLDENLGKPNLPLPSQSSVVPSNSAKTAALFFDRVWSPGSFGEKFDDIFFTGGTELEMWLGTAIALAAGETQGQIVVGPSALLQDSPIIVAANSIASSDFSFGMARAISESIRTAHGIGTVPMFSSSAAQDQAYTVGDARILVASIQNLGLIDDDKLSWDQVLEIRKDKESVAKLRKLRNWAESNMEGKPLSFMTDAIGARLSDYEWSVKKHGIQTVIGTMQSLVDPKFLAAAAITTGVGAEFGHGLTVGAVTIVGQTAWSIAERFLDLADARKGENAEVAYIHDIRKMQKKS